MQFRLLTLLVLTAVGPPLIALEWWYWKESSFTLLPLLVVSLSLTLWLLNLILWALERLHDALWRLMGAKPRGVPADNSN